MSSDGFVEHNPKALSIAIRKQNSQETAQEYAEMESLLQGMLALDPDERLTPEQALHHPFFVHAT